MSELERLKAEIERQDGEFAKCFEALAQVDRDLEIAVSPEWMSEYAATAASEAATTTQSWAQRA